MLGRNRKTAEIKKINFLLSSILAVSGSSLATAGNIYIEADGVAVNQQTSIQNTPGIPANSPHPPPPIKSPVYVITVEMAGPLNYA